MFFDAWLTHYNEQKVQWHKMVKVRFILSRLKMNRILCELKKQTRRMILRRVNSTMVDTNLKKRSLTKIFTKWK